MNLLCPSCQKTLQVAEQYAGQQMRCPLCGNPFNVPALAEPPETAAASAPTPAGTTAREEEIYGLGPPLAPPSSRPAAAVSTPPPRPSAPSPEPAPTPPATLPPPPPPGDYLHTSSLWISPRVLPWIAPAAFILTFVLLFFPWTGSYPGGVRVYSQTAWQGIWKGFYSNPVGLRVFDREAQIESAMSISVLMLLYVLLFMAALVIVVGLLAASQGPWQAPPFVKQFLPWRAAIAAALALAAAALLILQLLWGLSLENAVAEVADKSVDEMKKAATTDEDWEKVAIQRGLELGQFNLQRTLWLRLAVYCQLAAAIGAGLDLWLHWRGSRPTPRIDFLR